MNTIRKKQDLYQDEVRIGYVIMTYEMVMVEEFSEMSFSSVTAESNKLKFLLNVSHRVIYFNSGSIQSSLASIANEYVNYPVLLNTQINVQVKEDIDVSILDYSPKIINTEVSKTETNSDSKGKTTGTTKSSTTGNSVSANLSAGYSAFGPNIDVSVGYSHDWSDTASNENSNSSSKENSHGFSMSVEDWGAYASINNLADTQKGITWDFGQQNPWNALIYRKPINNPTNNEIQLAIPEYIAQKLVDSKTVLPPSGLALHGFDFVMQGNFLIKINNPLIDCIEVEHLFSLVKGSHKLVEDQIKVYRENDSSFLTYEPNPTEISPKQKIYPTILALKPIGQVFSSAIIGFHQNSFDLRPDSKSGFKIRSFENDLLIQSSQLEYFKNESPFSLKKNTLCLTIDEREVSFDIFFKISDQHKNYNLVIKHWLQDRINTVQNTGIELKFIINEDIDSVMIKYVTDCLQEGGESNILSLSLRNLDYTSIDFHNYLKVGVNKITVVVKKPEKLDDVMYLINAVSIVGIN